MDFQDTINGLITLDRVKKMDAAHELLLELLQGNQDFYDRAVKAYRYILENSSK